MIDHTPYMFRIPQEDETVALSGDERGWRATQVTLSCAHAATWRRLMGPEFPRFSTWLRRVPARSTWMPCGRCPGHRLVYWQDTIKGVCDHEDFNCPDYIVQQGDVELFEFDWDRLLRIFVDAANLHPRRAAMDMDGVSQIAAYGGSALPIIFSLQADTEQFVLAATRLVARLRQPFILITPTNRYWNVTVQELMTGVGAGLVSLSSFLSLNEHGSLRLTRRIGDVFNPFLPPQPEPATDNEASRLFHLLRQLDPGETRKAPLAAVFRMYLLDRMQKSQIAATCDCAPSLITKRLSEIERRFGRSVEELRRIAA